MPLLPLLVGCGCAGIRFLFIESKKRIDKWALVVAKVHLKPYIVPFLAVALSLLMIFMVFLSRSAYNTSDGSNEYTGVDFERITAELKREHLATGDMVYGDYLSTLCLSYYFERQGIPLQYLYSNAAGVENTPVDGIKQIFIVSDRGVILPRYAIRDSNLEFNEHFLIERTISVGDRLFLIFVYKRPDLWH